eukprot:s708_g6.t1
MQRPSRPVFVEVFAGEAGLSQAISARGMQVLPPIEILTNNFVTEPVDILDPLVYRLLQLLIKENLVAFIHFGTPCPSFSIARKHDGGPPPFVGATRAISQGPRQARDGQQIFGAHCAARARPRRSCAIWPSSLVHEPLVGYVVVNAMKVFKTKLAQVYLGSRDRASWQRSFGGNFSDGHLAGRLQKAGRSGCAMEAPQTTAHCRKGFRCWMPAQAGCASPIAQGGVGARTGCSSCFVSSTSFHCGACSSRGLAMVATCPQRVLGHRCGALRHWSARAHALLAQTEQILQAVPRLRQLVRGVPDDQPLALGKVTHIALWREMLQAANCIDRTLDEDLLHGFSIVAPIQRSRLWAALDTVDELLPVQALASRAWEFSGKVIKNVSRCEVTESTAKIWEATLKNVREGSSLGPFFSAQQVSSFLGIVDDWIPTQRFEVVQKNKRSQAGKLRGKLMFGASQLWGKLGRQSLIKKWLPRKSQIAMVELFATVVALKTFEAQLSNSWSLLLVDSEPVRGAVVKGYSAREDVCELVGVFWKIAFDLNINLYVDRVPTDANPADPPPKTVEMEQKGVEGRRKKDGREQRREDDDGDDDDGEDEADEDENEDHRDEMRLDEPRPQKYSLLLSADTADASDIDNANATSASFTRGSRSQSSSALVSQRAAVFAQRIGKLLQLRQQAVKAHQDAVLQVKERQHRLTMSTAQQAQDHSARQLLLDLDSTWWSIRMGEPEDSKLLATLLQQAEEAHETARSVLMPNLMQQLATQTTGRDDQMGSEGAEASRRGQSMTNGLAQALSRWWSRKQAPIDCLRFEWHKIDEAMRNYAKLKVLGCGTGEDRRGERVALFEGVHEALEELVIPGGRLTRSLSEILPLQHFARGSKRLHLRRIASLAHCKASQLLFLDNELQHCEDAAELGVTAACLASATLCQPGMVLFVHMSLAPALSEANPQVLPLTPRLDVVEKLERFLELKAQSNQTEQAKSLLWRCAAEGRGIHPFGVLSVTEVRQAISGFETQLQPRKKLGRVGRQSAAMTVPMGKAAKARYFRVVFKRCVAFFVAGAALQTCSTCDLKRPQGVATPSNSSELQLSDAGKCVSGIFTNDEVEKAIILGSGSKRSPKSDPALEAKAGAESASGASSASGAWHLLVEALRAERPAEAQAAQASQAPQAQATAATAAQPAQPRDGDGFAQRSVDNANIETFFRLLLSGCRQQSWLTMRSSIAAICCLNSFARVYDSCPSNISGGSKRIQVSKLKTKFPLPLAKLTGAVTRLSGQTEAAVRWPALIV